MPNNARIRSCAANSATRRKNAARMASNKPESVSRNPSVPLTQSSITSAKLFFMPVSNSVTISPRDLNSFPTASSEILHLSLNTSAAFEKLRVAVVVVSMLAVNCFIPISGITGASFNLSNKAMSLSIASDSPGYLTLNATVSAVRSSFAFFITKSHNFANSAGNFAISLLIGSVNFGFSTASPYLIFNSGIESAITSHRRSIA